jgi:hypothetical protein
MSILALRGLDFILEHPDHRYLTTQEDKLSYFFEQRGVDPQMLPSRFFRSNGTVTTRYFPDGFPQFLDRTAQPAYRSCMSMKPDSLRMRSARTCTIIRTYLKLSAQQIWFSLPRHQIASW